MKDVRSEIKETGKEQSAKANGETGNQQANNSKKGACGKTIVGIEAIASAINSQSIATAMQFINRYGLPAEKGPGSVWQMDVDKFEAWARDIGWTKKMHESELTTRIHRKNLSEAGPGNEIRGSITYLEKRLARNMTTLLDLMRDHESCPIKKLPDNQYSVDENAWALFMLDITPPRKTRREIPY
jgi:hypothetical protein